MSGIKTGQASNIPWWRLQNMSDEEIEKYNDSFMMIDGLTESVGIDVSESVLRREIWNEAIEAAAKEIEDSDDGKFQASKIRELKKIGICGRNVCRRYNNGR